MIDLVSNQKRTFGLSSGPMGVAFGADNLALILTQNEFLLLDPASGKTAVLDSVADVASQPLPVPLASFPLDITAAAMTATADGRHILGIAGNTPDKGDESVMVRFSYNTASHQITFNRRLTASPSLAPRAISASRDGSYYMSGWALFGCGAGFLGDCTAGGPLLSQWPNVSGEVNAGSVAIRSSKSLIYAQITPKGASEGNTTLPPYLLVLDADNLTVRERLQLSENLAGKSVFNADETTLYSISDSGVTVFSMAAVEKAPRVTATVEDVGFPRKLLCHQRFDQQVDVVDPGGNATPFQICVAGATSCTAPGITISPSSGVTPARVKITIDPTYTRSMIGTKAVKFEIRSVSRGEHAGSSVAGRGGDRLQGECQKPISRPGQQPCTRKSRRGCEYSRRTSGHPAGSGPQPVLRASPG